MLCEADIQVSWRARPRGFIALMSLYESNYLRLRHLVGDPAQLAGISVSNVAGDCDLRLEVIGHMSYTSTLNLTYLLPDARQPDLHLTVYHDARLLEVQTAPGKHGRIAGTWQTSQGERELHQRWTRNMMLNKWLEYCVERGHRFRREARLPA